MIMRIYIMMSTTLIVVYIMMSTTLIVHTSHKLNNAWTNVHTKYVITTLVSISSAHCTCNRWTHTHTHTHTQG